MTEHGIIPESTGSLFTVALTCPSCGAGLGFVEGSTRVVCDHCGLAHMVVGRKGELSYWIPNKLARHDAADRVRDLVSDRKGKETAGGAVHFIDSRLFYVPFFRASVTGGGWYIGKMAGLDYEWKESRNHQEIVVPREVNKEVMEGFFKELSYFTPAVDVSEMGLIGLWARSTALELLPFDPDAVAEGEVLTPLKDREATAREAWATLIASTKPAAMSLDYFEAEKVTEEIAMINYPVWIVRFLYEGSPTRVAVDGVGGDILFARVPKKGGARALPGLLILALIAFITTTAPPALVFVVAVALYLLVFKGWNWLWGRILRLFVAPWTGGEVAIG
jgi:hypothetical protein